jgi:hypothetical protein
MYVGQRFWVRAVGKAPMPLPRGGAVRFVRRRGTRAFYVARAAGTSRLSVKDRKLCGSRNRGRCVALVVHSEAVIPGALYVGYPYAHGIQTQPGDPYSPGAADEAIELQISPDGTLARFAAVFDVYPPCGNGDDLLPSPQDWPAIPIAPDGSFSATAVLGNGLNISKQTISGTFDGSVASVKFVFAQSCALPGPPQTYAMQFTMAAP